MEAIGEFIPEQAARPWSAIPTGSPRPAAAAGDSDATDCSLKGALALVRDATTTAVANAALFGVSGASDFSGRVEELSRMAEYLQIVAAAAVDRTRHDALTASVAAAARSGSRTGAPAGWLTGWNTAGTAEAGAPQDVPQGTVAALATAAAPESVDDGYRDTTAFLRARLRISASEARRRLSLAKTLLPRTGIARQSLPPAQEELAAAVASGSIASRAATIIALALDRVRYAAPPETAARMEHALIMTAVESDHDFLTRIAKSWVDALDQDGDEPSEEELRQRQGAFIRRTSRGLHRLEIFATTDQFEHLLTVMNVATNPRIGSVTTVVEQVEAAAASVNPASHAGTDDDAPEEAGAEHLDLRSRPQRLLDGLVGACKAALATGNLPSAGGLRPQVMVTIDYRHLLDQPEGAVPGAGASGSNTGAHSNTGTLMFTGPVTSSTVRRIACDADVIPVLLGGEGRILDIGRASRVFPPHIRKALTARDRGCAFPQCTIPASWCEAHHISYWSRGGSTGTGNGALLCSHHHHLIHKEQWNIQMRSGIPWFVPPPHVDPRQVPRRNRYSTEIRRCRFQGDGPRCGPAGAACGVQHVRMS
ncbi:DUF222 domain-containing protein [Pseudarthrobacter sp. O4]|uniref:HNH endonuclease signature motif containing protein n=1 Tax=Pseudarthrobacter sp. O4 TaxID=3418417 RepID=UPI003CF1910A